MWKNILATSFLILSVGVTYTLIQSANAQLGPQVSVGQNPIVNYGGTISQGTPVFTAPTDQDVIVTTLMTNDNSCQIVVDGNTIIPMSGYFSPTFLYTRINYPTNSQSAFLTGNAKLKVPAGTSLEFLGCSPHYYIEGYLMHP